MHPYITELPHNAVFQSINQSKFILSPFKIPTQRCSRPRPSGKEQSWEGGGIENRHWLVRSTGSPFQVFGPTTENEQVCIVAERANGTPKLPWTEDRSVRRPAHEERARYPCDLSSILPDWTTLTFHSLPLQLFSFSSELSHPARSLSTSKTRSSVCLFLLLSLFGSSPPHHLFIVSNPWPFVIHNLLLYLCDNRVYQ